MLLIVLGNFDFYGFLKERSKEVDNILGELGYALFSP